MHANPISFVDPSGNFAAPLLLAGQSGGTTSWVRVMTSGVIGAVFARGEAFVRTLYLTGDINAAEDAAADAAAAGFAMGIAVGMLEGRLTPFMGAVGFGLGLAQAKHEWQAGHYELAAVDFTLAVFSFFTGVYKPLPTPVRGAPLPTVSGATRTGPSEKVFGEYMHFRRQGFTPAQAKYLTQPYQGMGHHFPVPRRVARDWGLSDGLRDSRFNVLSPNGISRGRFYELHYKVDPHFHGASFPKTIGGSWQGSQIGLDRYGPWSRWWHATPGPTKVVGGVMTVGAGTAGGYWLFGGSDEE